MLDAIFSGMLRQARENHREAEAPMTSLFITEYTYHQKPLKVSEAS